MNDENIIEGYKKISFKISDNLAYQHASLATKKRRKNILKQSKPSGLIGKNERKKIKLIYYITVYSFVIYHPCSLHALYL